MNSAIAAKPRILCVDDEARNLELLEAVLGPMGCEVIFARGGGEALEIINKTPPDAVLMDVMMPGMSGFEALEKIRSGAATRALPVVMVTALSQTEPRVEALEKGADDFISKPFEKAEIEARVRSILRLEHYRAQLAEKEKLELVLDAVTDGICVCGPDLRVKTMNGGAGRLFGTEAAGALLPELLVKEFPAAPGAEKLAAPQKCVFELARPETASVAAAFYEMTAMPVKNRLGELTDLVFTFKNITSRKKEEVMKRDFLNVISHKLRTPLTSLTIGVPMLLDGSLGPLAPAQREMLAVLARTITWLERVLIGTLDFISVGAAGKPPLSDAAAVRAAAGRIATDLGGAGITINEKPGAPVSIPLGEKELELIFRSLMGNAARFGGPAPAILVELGSEDGGFEISVSDKGPGIPPEDQERIFEPFSQVEKYFTGNVEGAGIGLATVKKLAELKGGSVTVESRLGHGSKFTVKVPVI